MVELNNCVYALIVHTRLLQEGGYLYYQPAAHEAHGRLVLRLLCIFCVCWYICASALIMCTIITSRSLLVAMQPYLVDFGNLDGCFV